MPLFIFRLPLGRSTGGKKDLCQEGVELVEPLITFSSQITDVCLKPIHSGIDLFMQKFQRDLFNSCLNRHSPLLNLKG